MKLLYDSANKILDQVRDSCALVRGKGSATMDSIRQVRGLWKGQHTRFNVSSKGQWHHENTQLASIEFLAILL